MTMMNVATTTLGGRLRIARDIAGIDQDTIGRAVGASRPTVSKWERDITEPTVSQLMLWAQTTNQPVEAILDGLIPVVRPKGLEPLTFCSVGIDVEYELLCLVEAVCS